MTNPMFNPQPNYSGVTIQIANPSVYAGGNGAGVNGAGVNSTGVNSTGVNGGVNPAVYNPYVQNPIVQSQSTNPYAQLDPAYNAVPQPNTQQPSYPPQYYLNNYNYTNNGTANGAIPENFANTNDDVSKGAISDNAANNITNDTASAQEIQAPEDAQSAQTIKNTKEYEVKPDEPQDFTKSQAVIDDLDARAAAEEEAKKNSTQKRVVALTDEYIKSLENYLNNPNDEIRLMASKEILTRLDEDKDRFDDAALNALLNKMLQDPSKLIRVASLSAFASQLASGNDYTVTLLQNIQQNPNADKEDILQAADILLKMSGGTEVKNIPNPAEKEKDEAEQ